MRRLGRRVAFIVVGALSLGACNVDVTVDVDAHDDGHGDVRVTAVLDAEAAKEAGDLTVRLRTDDLEDAGWVVEPPRPLGGGQVSQTIRHRFDSPEHAARVLAQLGGEGGPLAGLAIDQRRTFFRTTTTFRGTLDLREGIEAFSDDQLTAALGGQAVGVPVGELERRMGASFAEVFGLRFEVELPGGERAWSPALGERVTMAATAKRWNVANILALVVAVVTTAAFAMAMYRRFTLQARGAPVESPDS